MTLSLTWETCVRTRSLSAECRACVDVCPASALSLDGPRGSVKVDLGKCTSCGLCQGECPTQSFAGAVDVDAFLAGAGEALACTDAFCLAALSVEELITHALKHQKLRVDVASCKSAQQLLASRVEAAREFLVASGLEPRIVTTLSPSPRNDG